MSPEGGGHGTATGKNPEWRKFEERCQDENPLFDAGVGQLQRVGFAVFVPKPKEIDVEGAGPPSTGSLPFPLVLDPSNDHQQLEGGEGTDLNLDNRIEKGRLVDVTPGWRLDDRATSKGRDASMSEEPHRCLEFLPTISEIASQTQPYGTRSPHSSPRGWGSSSRRR